MKLASKYNSISARRAGAVERGTTRPSVRPSPKPSTAPAPAPRRYRYRCCCCCRRCRRYCGRRAPPPHPRPTACAPYITDGGARLRPRRPPTYAPLLVSPPRPSPRPGVSTRECECCQTSAHTLCSARRANVRCALDVSSSRHVSRTMRN